jgi:hypothetical protein
MEKIPKNEINDKKIKKMMIASLIKGDRVYIISPFKYLNDHRQFGLLSCLFHC